MVKYGSDKANYHVYTPFYEGVFSNREVNRLLEIGIYKGSSLRAWRDFFPEAQIYGWDNDRTTLFQENRIHTYWADQRNQQSMAEALEKTSWRKFDVIIDDAYHEPEDQISCCNFLLSVEVLRGLYIIEDVRTKEIALRLQREIHADTRVIECGSTYMPDDRLVVIGL